MKLDELLISGANQEGPAAVERSRATFKSKSFSHRRSESSKQHFVVLPQRRVSSMNARYGASPSSSLSSPGSRQLQVDLRISNLTPSSVTSVPEGDHEGNDSEAGSPARGHASPRSDAGSPFQQATGAGQRSDSEVSEAPPSPVSGAINTHFSGPSRLQRVTSARDAPISAAAAAEDGGFLDVCEPAMNKMEHAAAAALAALKVEEGQDQHDSRPRQAAHIQRLNPWAPLPGPCYEAAQYFHAASQLMAQDSMRIPRLA